MKVIEHAFSEAIQKSLPVLRTGWWGCFLKEKYYIMRYNHVMVQFDKNKYTVITNDTVTDKAGVKDSIERIVAWQKHEK